MQQEVIKGINNSIIINYNNNVNYYWVRLLLNECANRSINKPLILILGDIENHDINALEYIRGLHYEIGRQASTVNFTYLIAMGTWAEEYIQGAKSKGVNRNQLYCFKTANDLIPFINKFILFNSLVVFIGNFLDSTPIINKIKTNSFLQ